MNILFLLPRYSQDVSDSTLEKELVQEFSRHGHKVYVATINERKNQTPTQLNNENGIEVLRIKTGNFRGGVSKIEKGLTKLTIPTVFYLNIRKHIGTKDIDLVVTSTPAMNSSFLHGQFKKMFSCEILLLVWDFFPQNAVDLGMLKNKYLIRFFEKKFKLSLETSDFITVMSKGNKDFVLDRYPQLSKKVFILKNWSLIKPLLKSDRNFIRAKYQLLQDDFVCVFGGNIGWLQEPENLIDLAESVKHIEDIKFLFVGDGTEKKKMLQLCSEKKLDSVRFLDRVFREEYEELISACDVGLISLHRNFRVPNFPSRTTDYFKLSLPILASLDECALNDYGIFLEKEAKAGFAVKAGDTKILNKYLLKLYKDKQLREILGFNGRKYYEEKLGVDRTYDTIMKNIYA